MEKNTFISVDITYFDDSPHLTSGYISYQQVTFLMMPMLLVYRKPARNLKSLK